MHTTRRKFVRQASALGTSSLLLPYWACTSPPPPPTNSENPSPDTPAGDPSLATFGIQLYTLRDILPDDPKGVLKQVADMGYKQIEGYEGDMGLFWGMSNSEFKAYMDELGLDFVASHCKVEENFEEKAAQAAEIGMKYLICPWIGPQESMEGFKEWTEKFNACGEICKKNGIRFAYHNHGYSFKELEGVIPQDYMMDNTDPGLVDFELDMYWVVTAQADIISYLEKYPNRFPLCHIKDRIKDAEPEERDASTDLGTGSIDYPHILKVAEDNGMQYYLLEQERYDNSTPIDSAKVGAEYLKKLVFA